MFLLKPVGEGMVLLMLQVWVDAWQMQCCGDAFGVEDLVRWTLHEDATEESLIDEDGVRAVVRVTHREEHHGGLPEDTPATVGYVRKVRAVFSEYGEDPNGSRVFVRVPATSRSEERLQRVDGWESDSLPGEGRVFEGYLVDLALVEG